MNPTFQRRRLLVAASALPLLGLAQSPEGSNYPARPVRLLVPMPPGGSSDAVLRLVAPKWSERLGQPIVIENKPGAGGSMSLRALVQAPADGYTLAVGAAGALAATSLFTNLPYDPVRDFSAVSLLAHIPFVLVAHPAAASRNLPELLEQARRAPAVPVAHAGNGTVMHLSIQLLGQMSGVSFSEVAYRGNGPAVADVLAGHVPYAMLDLPSSLESIRAGKLRPLMVTSRTRLDDLPEVPTAHEGGVKAYESTGWFGVVARAKTPATVFSRVRSALEDALTDRDVRARARGLGVDLAPSRPEEFQRFIATETAKWSQVIKNSGLRLQ